MSTKKEKELSNKIEELEFKIQEVERRANSIQEMFNHITHSSFYTRLRILFLPRMD